MNRQHGGPLTRSEAWRVLQVMLIALAVIVAALLVWRLTDVLLLAFGAILTAVLLRALSDLVTRYAPLSDRWALALSAVLVAAVLLGFIALLGTQVQEQFNTLVEGVPDLIKAVEEALGTSGLRSWLEERLTGVLSGGGMAANVATYSGTILSTIANIFLVIFAGIYLAIDPGLYRRGLAKLFTARPRDEVDDTLVVAGEALKLWLLGQLIAMVLVGILTTAGLMLLGIPSALALGLIAALLEFVPFIGPVLAAIPAIALGLTEGPGTAAMVLGLYVLVQQIEGNIITPLVQQRTVDLPPAITIFAILTFGVLFGPVGILFAVPLAVVSYVVIQKIWMQDVLHEETDVPGEEKIKS